MQCNAHMQWLYRYGTVYSTSLSNWCSDWLALRHNSSIIIAAALTNKTMGTRLVHHTATHECAWREKLVVWVCGVRSGGGVVWTAYLEFPEGVLLVVARLWLRFDLDDNFVRHKWQQKISGKFCTTFTMWCVVVKCVWCKRSFVGVLYGMIFVSLTRASRAYMYATEFHVVCCYYSLCQNFGLIHHTFITWWLTFEVSHHNSVQGFPKSAGL